MQNERDDDNFEATLVVDVILCIIKLQFADEESNKDSLELNVAGWSFKLRYASRRINKLCIIWEKKSFHDMQKRSVN
jgi:hypothetical protein